MFLFQDGKEIYLYTSNGFVALLAEDGSLNDDMTGILLLGCWGRGTGHGHKRQGDKAEYDRATRHASLYVKSKTLASSFQVFDV